MKIIDQYHEVLYMDALDRVERAGRTCYKSEGKIGCQHPALDADELCPVYEPHHFGHCAICEHHSSHRFIKQLIKRGHEAMLEHGSATVKFVTNRGVTHELVRHRMASFGQESTRYVNYGGKDIEFIRPVWSTVKTGEYSEFPSHPSVPADDRNFLSAMLYSAMYYKELLGRGWRPEQAREVLPNALKTEIVVTANYREWRHIFKLRAIGTTGKPHPQMQALMLPVLKEFTAKLPALFEDLEVN